MKKIIFGKAFQFNAPLNFKSVLDSSLSLYKTYEGENVDVLVTIDSLLPEVKNITSINPKIHSSTSTGMKTVLGSYPIHWFFSDDCLNVNLHFTFKKGVIHWLKKYKGMECSTVVEEFVQVIHELILIPSVYFFSDLAPIHASSVRVREKLYIFAGTGGVGKSSSMLSLSAEQNTFFMSDDIVVINKNGKVFPNFAWPKIYGYNCEGNNIEKLLLCGRGLLDKIQFKIKKKLNPAKVRRKIEPSRLYPQVANAPVFLDTLYYLVKEDVKEISVVDISLKQAVSMSIKVMTAEYQVFHNHIHWEEYNSLATKGSPMLSMEAVLENWENVLCLAFRNSSIKKISIPLNYSHKKLMETAKTWIKY